MSASAPRRPPEGDVSIAYQLEVGALVTLVAAAAAVTLRTWARTKYARLGWDDWLMLFALVQALVATALDFVATAHGLGRHLFFLAPEQRTAQQFWNVVSQVFCIDSLTFGKLSVGVSYLRVMRGAQRRRQGGLRGVICGAMAVVFAVNAAVIVSLFAQCSPAAKAWDTTLPGSCWAFPIAMDLAIMQGSVSAFTDFLLAAIPVFLFRDLQVGRKSKTVLCGLMGLGAITGAFALVRVVQTAKSIHSSGPPDSSYGSVSPLLWAGMERNIGIFAASVAPARPLVHPFMRLTSRVFSFTRSRSHGSVPQNREVEVDYPHRADRRVRYMPSHARAPSWATAKGSKLSTSTDGTWTRSVTDSGGGQEHPELPPLPEMHSLRASKIFV